MQNNGLVRRGIDLFKKNSVQQIVGVLGGQASKAGLGFLSIIITARLLSVEDFGLFSLFIASIAVTTELSGKSFDWGMVRYSALYIAKSRQKADLYFKTVFKLRIYASLLILFLVVLFVGPVSKYVFHRPDYEMPILFAGISTLAMSLWWFSQAVVQAEESFKLYSVFNFIGGFIKITVVACLSLLCVTDLRTVLEAYTGIFF